jgi:hypothetical protein
MNSQFSSPSLTGRYCTDAISFHDQSLNKIKGITLPWSDRVFAKRQINIVNMNMIDMIWMEMVDGCLVSSVQVEDIGAWAVRTIHRFWGRKCEQQLTHCLFWRTETRLSTTSLLLDSKWRAFLSVSGSSSMVWRAAPLSVINSQVKASWWKVIAGLMMKIQTSFSGPELSKRAIERSERFLRDPPKSEWQMHPLGEGAQSAAPDVITEAMIGQLRFEVSQRPKECDALTSRWRIWINLSTTNSRNSESSLKAKE